MNIKVLADLITANGWTGSDQAIADLANTPGANAPGIIDSNDALSWVAGNGVLDAIILVTEDASANAQLRSVCRGAKFLFMDSERELDLSDNGAHRQMVDLLVTANVMTDIQRTDLLSLASGPTKSPAVVAGLGKVQPGHVAKAKEMLK